MAEGLRVTKVGAIVEMQGNALYVTRVGAIVEMELARLVVTAVGVIVEMEPLPASGFSVAWARNCNRLLSGGAI